MDCALKETRKKYKITTIWNQEYYEYGIDEEDAIFQFLISWVSANRKDITSCVEVKE